MIITIKPDDIIKRGLWCDYKKFILKDKSEDEIVKIVTENHSLVISENDAYVIGLIKVLETDNLIHRFNITIQDILQIKSNIFDDGIYINKNVIYKEITSYKNRFPSYWNAEINYKKAVILLFDYIDKIKAKLDNIESFMYTNKDKEYEFLDVKQVTKQLDL